MLYKRDYTILSEKEAKQLQRANDYYEKFIKKGMTPKQVFRYHEMIPKAGYHYESLFPNNYLDIGELDDHERLNFASSLFKELLDTDGVNERSILNFINSNEYYFFVGAILSSSIILGIMERTHFGNFLCLLTS